MQAAPNAMRTRRAVVLGTLVAGVLLAAAALFPIAGQRESVTHGGAAVEPTPVAMPGPTSFAELEKAPAAPAPPVAPAGADDEIQLCGGHWVKAGADGKPAEEAMRSLAAQSLEAVSAAALAAMAESPSPRVQAAAHYYQARRNALWTQPRDRSSEAMAHRDALVRIAQVSDDAQIYAWAYRACRSAPPEAPGACMQISAAQWARLDPGNAEPWLAIAAEARRRKDEAALDDAMFHVAVAGQHRSGWATLAATVARHAPQDEASLLGLERAVAQAIGIEGIDATPWPATVEYCSARALADPNRRETCERVAAVLTERSTGSTARSVGMAMGRRLGWNPERLAALVDQRDAEQMAARLRSGDAARSRPRSCGALRTTVERVLVSAELGEIEMRRREVAATGQPVAKLAAEARRQRERDVRQVAAEEAAAAASAATAAVPASAASAPLVAQR